MKVYQTNEIRNVAIVGGTRAGKTSLGEAMLFEGGVLNRRGSVEDSNTVSDYKEIEIERGGSVFTAILSCEYKDKKLNVLDTPGLDDFVGEVCSALKVSDSALLVLNSQNGVEVGTEISWRTTARLNTPVVFAINQLDHEKANYDETLRQMETQFGSKVTAVQYPINPGIGFNAIIDLIKMRMITFAQDGKATEADIPAEEMDKAENLRAALVESAAENDDTLMEKFFENGSLNHEEISQGIKLGIINRGMFPVFCISAKHNMGVARLMDFIIDSCPSPIEAPAMKKTDGTEVAYKESDTPQLFVFKTTNEPHLGDVSFFKVTAGTITESLDMINANTDSKERVSQLFSICGKNRTKLEKVVAGDIAATIKLKDTNTNNTLNSAKGAKTQIEPIIFPEPKHRAAVKAVNSTDDEKLGGILKQIHQDDPTVLVEQSVELKQTIVSGQGELHLNAVKWRIEKQDKIEINFIPPKIPYRETITKPAKAMYRHKKQSGGAGQFGEVHMLVHPYTEGGADQTEFPIRGRDEHPLSWGGKLVFNSCIVGGVIDARFMPAILKGIMEKIEEGPLTGSYARDIVVNIYDGKMHPVDSNEISFKLAGRNAFREAFKNAGPKILEPIYDVEVLVPDDRMGDVMTDLQGRRAIIMGMDAEGNYQKIRARVPLAEMNKYSTSLSSLTSGRATFTMKFSEYQQVPLDVQEKLLKAYEAEQKEED